MKSLMLIKDIQREAADLAQWIRMRLSSRGPWFKSQTQHPRIIQLIFDLCVKRTKIKQKETGIGTFLNRERVT